jgi:hypothetical protein
MTGRYESRIERAIREAQERGDFDNLPGAGKPIPGRGEPYDENWWINEFAARENISGVLPATMRLRKEIEDLPETVARETAESSVRDVVAELNERIRRAQRGLADGPPVVLLPVDVEDAVRAWRERAAPAPPDGPADPGSSRQAEPELSPGSSPERRRWWTRSRRRPVST